MYNSFVFLGQSILDTSSIELVSLLLFDMVLLNICWTEQEVKREKERLFLFTSLPFVAFLIVCFEKAPCSKPRAQHKNILYYSLENSGPPPL